MKKTGLLDWVKYWRSHCGKSCSNCLYYLPCQKAFEKVKRAVLSSSIRLRSLNFIWYWRNQCALMFGKECEKCLNYKACEMTAKGLIGLLTGDRDVKIQESLLERWIIGCSIRHIFCSKCNKKKACIAFYDRLAKYNLLTKEN